MIQFPHIHPASDGARADSLQTARHIKELIYTVRFGAEPAFSLYVRRR
jgi:hypothetical protein